MMGRPPKPKGEVKDVTFLIRMTKAERALLERAAKSQSEGASTWARELLLAAANRLLRKS
jgi:hypothetical protein